MTFTDKIELSQLRDVQVHVEDCCAIHGCKHGDHNCPVTTHRAKQAYPCDECDEMIEDHSYDHWV
jgi:hypothetical protein